jgi:hypothetical protein
VKSLFPMRALQAVEIFHHSVVQCAPIAEAANFWFMTERSADVPRSAIAVRFMAVCGSNTFDKLIMVEVTDYFFCRKQI